MSTSAFLQSEFSPYQLKAELRGEISVKQPRWLTVAIAASVHRVRGLTKVIAAALGEREGAVYEVADVNNPKPLKAAWIPTIVRETESFAILDALERQVGRVAFRLLDGDVDECVLHRELSAAVKQFGEVIEATGDALEDNRIEPHECPAVVKEIDEAIAQLCQLRARIIAKAEQDAKEPR